MNFVKDTFPLKILLPRTLQIILSHLTKSWTCLAALSWAALLNFSLKPNHLTCDSSLACSSEMCSWLKESYLVLPHMLLLEEFQPAISFPHPGGVCGESCSGMRGKPVIPAGSLQVSAPQDLVTVSSLTHLARKKATSRTAWPPRSPTAAKEVLKSKMRSAWQSYCPLSVELAVPRRDLQSPGSRIIFFGTCIEIKCVVKWLQ